VNDASPHGEASSLGITDQEAVEISRIINEYKRRERELPPDCYGWQFSSQVASSSGTTSAMTIRVTRTFGESARARSDRCFPAAPCGYGE